MREEEIIGKTFGEFHSPEETAVFTEKSDPFLRQGTPFSMSTEVKGIEDTS